MDGGPHVAGRRRAGDALSVARTHLMFSTPVIVDHVDGAEAMNAELLKLIEERRGLDEGVVRSNTGGWHSKQDFVNWSGEPSSLTSGESAALPTRRSYSNDAIVERCSFHLYSA